MGRWWWPRPLLVILMGSGRRMKGYNMLRWALLIILAILALLSVPLFLVHKAESSTEHFLRQPETIMEACRELITHRMEYRNDNPGWTAAYSKTDVILNPQKAPLEANVPEVFRRGRLAYIVIHSNAVTVCVSTLPKRYLLAFGSSAIQHGDKKIIDGLWLSFGNFR
jgi:hypothetical protein